MTRNKTTIVTIVTCVLIGILALGMLGVILQVFTPYKPSDWFNKELVATTEEEMNKLLTEENIGKSVRYTGETVNKVALPYAVGDVIDGMYFNVEFDNLDFLQGLDWENADIKYDGDGKTDVIFLMTTGEYSIDDLRTVDLSTEGDFEKVAASGLLLAYRAEFVEEGDNQTMYAIGCFDSDFIFSYYFLNGELDSVESRIPEGYNFYSLSGKEGAESYEITWISPLLTSGENLFLGVEDGNYGTAETVFVKDQVYTIEKAEDGTLAFVIVE